jgi:hypothetical protein
VAAAVVICLLVYLVLRDTRGLLLVLSNLPFALIGGALTVFASGGLLTLGSMVGFVTLFGIKLRNSIMLISHCQHLVQREGQPWNSATATLGASERLAPILMTALVTGSACCRWRSRAASRGTRSKGRWPWSSWADRSRRPFSTCGAAGAGLAVRPLRPRRLTLS